MTVDAAPRARRPWPVWLTAAAVLAVLLVSVPLLAALAPPWLVALLPAPALLCRVAPDDQRLLGELNDERAHEQALQRALADARDQVARKRVACAPQQTRIAEVDPKPQPQPQPPPEPQPQPTPRKEPAPQPPPEQKADLPAEKWQQRDVSLLEGCWHKSLGMQVRVFRTNRVRRARAWEMCFDKSGKGRETLEFDDGVKCRGPAASRFGPDGTLEVNTAPMQCDDGMQIVRKTSRCTRDSDNEANCIAYEPDLGNRTHHTFRR